MNAVQTCPRTSAPQTAVPDFAAIKQKQQATWASGDFAVIGTTLQIVGESLAEALDVRAGEQVLDIAAGNGNATLAAARRFAEAFSAVAELVDVLHVACTGGARPACAKTSSVRAASSGSSLVSA